MIAQISGKLAQKQPGEIIIDVGGVGYLVFISLNVFYRLPDIGAPLSLQIHTHVREDALQLFGFQDHTEKQVFLMLTSVSGIAADDLARARKTGDQVRLVAIPGVGRKLAERMVVELKDKFASLAPSTGDSTDKPAASSQMMHDAVSALINLGYKKPEIEKTVREVLKNGETSLENVLRETLRHMSHSFG